MFDLQNINSLLNTLSIPGLGLNFLDFLIIIFFLFYVFEGYAAGFVGSFFDFISFILSFILGIKFYGFLGGLIASNFSIPIGFANAVGFFVAAAILEIFFNFLFKKIFSYLSSYFKPKNESKYLKQANKILGIFPAGASALVLLAFFLTLIIALPLSPLLKKAVAASRFGSVLVSKTTVFEKSLNNVFGGAVSEALNFLTIEPQSDEFVNLKFKVSNFKADPVAEEEMFNLVNKERTARGLSSLIFDNKIRDVARAHSEDMFERGYFSHFTPEKLSPFDRMAGGDIRFNFAGENLALAPSVNLAMEGLMNSPGHRENILSPNFRKIGIGAIDGGAYGLMFTQNFTD